MESLKYFSSRKPSFIPSTTPVPLRVCACAYERCIHVCSYRRPAVTASCAARASAHTNCHKPNPLVHVYVQWAPQLCTRFCTLAVTNFSNRQWSHWRIVKQFWEGKEVVLLLWSWLYLPTRPTLHGGEWTNQLNKNNKIYRMLFPMLVFNSLFWWWCVYWVNEITKRTVVTVR